MNAILRPTILYAADMYYNLNENELRHLERIEEEYLRKVFKTKRGCPIVQLYLEGGQYPARFEIQRMRCLYLKYVLHQDDNTLLKRFFDLQLEHSSKGDWVNTCLADLQELNIKESFDEIRKMGQNEFSNMLKMKIKKNALQYLIQKQRSKGTEITYSDIEMADYLKPFNSKLSIEQKQKLFAIRNRMVEISENFPGKEISSICHCGTTETMSHIYYCEKWNNGIQPSLKYEKIFTGRISDQIMIFEKFEENFGKREKMNETMNEKQKPPCDPCDPLSCTVDSNG